MRAWKCKPTTSENTATANPYKLATQGTATRRLGATYDNNGHVMHDLTVPVDVLPTPKGFDITVVSKMKHAVLYEAAKKLGSQSDLARYLGEGPSSVCSWVNMKGCPPVSAEEACKLRNWTKRRFRRLEKKLFDLTGKTMEELFPPELRDNKAFLEAEKIIERTKNVSMTRLDRMTAPSLPPPEDEIDFKHLQRNMDEALGSLEPREREIIELRFGFRDGTCHTLKDVGSRFGIQQERTRQIELTALRKLRQPSRSQLLVPFI